MATKTETKKKCSSCGGEKNRATDFHKNGSARDGLQTYCKECIREYAKKKSRSVQLEAARKPKSAKSKVDPAPPHIVRRRAASTTTQLEDVQFLMQLLIHGRDLPAKLRREIRDRIKTAMG